MMYEEVSVIVKREGRMAQVMRAPSAKRASNEKEEKLRELVQYLQNLQGEKFTGYVKVNFSQGSLCRIERFEEVLKG
jgi:hypothetical protein